MIKNSAVRKPDIRVKKTYDKLYHAFFETLIEKSYESITVLDLCEKANVHRATFYKHFVDKQDFVSFCCNRLLDELDLTNETRFLGEGDESKTAYINMCRKVINFVHENRQFIIDIANAPGSDAFNNSLIHAFVDLFEKRLTKIVSAGGHISSPVSMLSNYYAGAIVSLIKWWALEGERYTKDDILRFAVARLNEAEITFLQNKSIKEF